MKRRRRITKVRERERERRRERRRGELFIEGGLKEYGVRVRGKCQRWAMQREIPLTAILNLHALKKIIL